MCRNVDEADVQSILEDIERLGVIYANKVV